MEGVNKDGRKKDGSEEGKEAKRESEERKGENEKKKKEKKTAKHSAPLSCSSMSPALMSRLPSWLCLSPQGQPQGCTAS